MVEENSSAASAEPEPITLAAIMTALNDRFDSVESTQKEIKDRIARLETKNGLLVEEKARGVAERMFGSDFSSPFLIKSIHDLVKLVSKANDPKIPSDDYNARNAAVLKLVKVLEPLRQSFAISAASEIYKVAQDPLFQQFAPTVEEIGKVKKEIEKPENSIGNIEKNCGKLLGLVQVLSVPVLSVSNETEGDAAARSKKMQKAFKKKLERIKKGCAANVDNLADCGGPGILFACALTKCSAEDLESTKEWIEKHCNIFDFNEEVECDMRGKVALVDHAAIIEAAEIKSSFTEMDKAKKQLELRVSLVKFALDHVFEKGRFQNVITKGHLFVLEPGDKQQTKNCTVENGMSLFVYTIH